MFHRVLDVVVAIAALVSILDFFGLRPGESSSWNVMPLNRKWKLALMLGLVAAALAMSGYSFYRATYPKIVEKVVEKPVDRIVEKTVPQQCPQPKPVPPRKSSQPGNSPAQKNSGDANTNTQIGTAQGPVAIAPNGIANAAPNLGTQSVTNFGPPPITFSFTARDVDPPMDGDKPSQYKYEKEVTITPSASYSPVSVAVICDADLESVSALPQQGGAELSPMMGTAFGNKHVALIYFAGSPVTPWNPLVVTLRANQPISVSKVEQAAIRPKPN